MLKVPKLLERLCIIGNEFEDSLSIVDMHTTHRECIYVNKKFCEETGYSFQEIVGKNLSFLQGKGTSETASNYMRDSFAKSEACCVDILNYTKAGHAYINRLVLMPIQFGGEFYYLGFQNNMTKFGGVMNQKALLDISSQEIKHMIRNPLNVILTKLQIQLNEQDFNIDEVLISTKMLFKRINNFCLNIENPESFSGYNPYRS